MARTKLLKSLVDSLKPGPKDIVVWDDVVRGFHLKVTPTGRKLFYVYYRARRTGEQRRQRIGEFGVWTVEKARDEARRILVERGKGQDPSGELQRQRKAATKLSQLWESHLPEAQRRWRQRTAYETEKRWERHVLPRLGAMLLDEITSADVKEMHVALADTPSEANNCVALVRSLLNVAIADGLLPGPNAAAAVKPYKEVARELYLTGDQLVCLMTAIDTEEREGGIRSVQGRIGESKGRGGPGLKEARSRGISTHAAGLFRLLIFTGARLNEIQSARWSWIDWGQSALRLPELASKTGKKTVWLNELAVEELRRLQTIRSKSSRADWIIEGRLMDCHLVNAEKPWRRVRDLAAQLFQERIEKEKDVQGTAEELRTVRLHDLRHTFASFGVAAGLPLFTVGKTLGHSKASTTERYAHVSDHPLKAAAETIGASIRTAIAESTANVVPVPGVVAAKARRSSSAS